VWHRHVGVILTDGAGTLFAHDTFYVELLSLLFSGLSTAVLQSAALIELSLSSPHPAVQVMLLLHPIIAVFAWIAYSVLQRRAHRGHFASIRCLSELRRPDGDASKLPDIAKQMKKASKLPDDWEFLAGDDTTPRDCNVRTTKDVALCYDESSTKFGLFGKKPAPNLSLRQLVSKRPPTTEEDIFRRTSWQCSIDACVRATSAGSMAIEGEYCFCFRDYVNFEEFSSILANLKGVEWFLLRSGSIAKLSVEDGECKLVEKLIMFGILPLIITWEGNLVYNSIKWSTSSLRIGWARFGKTIDRPPAAEKLRADPWDVYFPKDEESSGGDIVVFHRVGEGKLVYEKRRSV